MIYDVDRSVIISEPYKNIVELFVTANERVEPSVAVFGVVLGLEDSAEKKDTVYINLSTIWTVITF